MKEAPLKDLIDKLFKAYGWDQKMKEMDIRSAWPELMGVAVANRTKNIQFRNSIMYLTMDSSVMREELLHGKHIIIDRVNEKAGCELIKDIFFA